MQGGIDMKAIRILCIFLIIAVCAGCAGITRNTSRPVIEKIEKLSQENQELTLAKALLEERLSREINDKQVKLKMMEKGLVISFVADILYDSGNAKLRPEAYLALDKVAEVLKGGVSDSNIGIEGHTDDQPIKYSSWKSNWELSAARALGVLHYLIDKGGIVPSRLSVSAFGEYQPVAPNGTKEGNQLNRRVEIVILPVLNKERKEITQDADNTLPEPPAENLK
jgi:chemotaxis protein MotB